MIIGTDILIMSVLHTEALRDHTKLDKSKSFIKMSCMDIAGHNRIKLQDTKTMLFSPDQAIGYQLFANMKSSGISAYRIAGVTDMTASSDIIRMKDVKSVNFSAFCIYCCSCIGLFCKKSFSCLFVKAFFLGKSHTVFYNLIPDPDQIRKIFFFVFSYCNIHDDLLYLSSSTFRPSLWITPSSERFLISRIMALRSTLKYWASAV